MSENFHSLRFNKKVWLTNHAIEAMNKRNVKLEEVKQLIELGQYKSSIEHNGWIYHTFEKRNDNLMCAAVINDESIIIKTIMINWSLRGDV